MKMKNFFIKKAILLFNKIGHCILSFSMLVTGLYIKFKIYLYVIYLEKASFFFGFGEKTLSLL